MKIFAFIIVSWMLIVNIFIAFFLFKSLHGALGWFCALIMFGLISVCEIVKEEKQINNENII